MIRAQLTLKIHKPYFCGRFILWPLYSVSVSFSGLFILWPLYSVASLFCGIFILWPLYSVAVSFRGLSILWHLHSVAGFESPKFCSEIDILLDFQVNIL